MSFPRYGEYKDSGVEWLGEVPGHWEVCAIKRIAEFFYGDALPTDTRDENGNVPVFGSNGAFGRHATSNTKSPAILIGRKGSCGALNWSDVESFAIDTVYFVDILKCQGLIRWFYWALHISDLTSASQDTGVPGLSRDFVYNVKLPRPTPEEQSAIAAFLDRQTAKIDALVAEQEKLIALLAEKRQAVISHAVTKGLNPAAPLKDSGIEWLGEVPEHWEFKRFKDVCEEIVDCKNRTPDEHENGGYFVVRTSCVRDGKFDAAPGYYTDEKNFREWTAKGLPQSGDVLFTREAPTGEACLAPENIPFCLGQRMMYLRPNSSQMSSDFLLYIIYGPMVRNYIDSKSKGSTVGHLRVGEVGELPAPVPPKNEQVEIVRALGKLEAKFDNLTAEARRAIDLLKEHRSALISAAVTGKIDVRGFVDGEVA